MSLFSIFGIGAAAMAEPSSGATSPFCAYSRPLLPPLANHCTLMLELLDDWKPTKSAELQVVVLLHMGR